MLIYIINRELTNGCSVLGGFFASILLWVHGSKTGFFGGILICESWPFEPDGLLISCFCDMYTYIYHFLMHFTSSAGPSTCMRAVPGIWEGVVVVTTIFFLCYKIIFKVMFTLSRGVRFPTIPILSKLN